MATLHVLPDSEDLIRGIYADSSRMVTYLHLDSTISLIWHDGIFADKVFIAFGEKQGLINLKNGKTSFMDLRIMQKMVDNSLGKGLITIEDWRKKNENIKKSKEKGKSR